jgi:hypothetical protein
MKYAVCALILAFAVPAAGGTDQAKPKDKAKPAPAFEQAGAQQGKGKDKSKLPAAGAPAGGAVTGGASCAPDATPPVIASVSATPSTLGAPNHKMTPVSINVKVADNCTTPTWTVTSVSSNEPLNGTGDGDTEPDWTIAGHNVTLRAERAGTGSGRTYTVTVTAKDAAGNTSTGTTTVSVPHNR